MSLPCSSETDGGRDGEFRDRLDFFFFSSRRRHTRFDCDWSSDVCSSDLVQDGLLTRDGEKVSFAHHSFQEYLCARDLADPTMASALEGVRRYLLGDNWRSEEHTSELQSQSNLVCRLLLEKKKKNDYSPK